MEDERRRDGIEQLRIVDAEDHPPARGASAEIVGAAPEQRHDVVGSGLVGDELRDRRQRNRCCAARGLDPANKRPVTLGGGLPLAGEPRFANAGIGDDNDPVGCRVGAGGCDRLELRVTADERPVADERGNGR